MSSTQPASTTVFARRVTIVVSADPERDLSRQGHWQGSDLCQDQPLRTGLRYGQDQAGDHRPVRPPKAPRDGAGLRAGTFSS